MYFVHIYTNQKNFPQCLHHVMKVGVRMDASAGGDLLSSVQKHETQTCVLNTENKTHEYTTKWSRHENEKQTVEHEGGEARRGKWSFQEISTEKYNTLHTYSQVNSYKYIDVHNNPCRTSTRGVLK